MAARAGIVWISTNPLDVQRVRQVHNHHFTQGQANDRLPACHHLSVP